MAGRGFVRLFIAALCAASMGLVATGSGAASAAPRWASIQSATIRPGNLLSGCTSNFIFTHGNDVLIGSAAHCTGTGGNTQTNGCTTTDPLPLGTRVDIQGATKPGTLVYSSWNAMRAVKEPNPNVCRYNDFALIKIDPVDHARVNPTMRHWGGPTGLATGLVQKGDQVFTYGQSSLRLGLTALSPHRGQSQGPIGGNWNFRVRTILPGVPGDSGSGFLNNRGQATGVLSTLNPVLLQNGVANLHFAMIYARAHGMPQLQLALGTNGFTTGRGTVNN